MKFNRSLLALFLALFALCTVLTGCDEPHGAHSDEIEYDPSAVVQGAEQNGNGDTTGSETHTDKGGASVGGFASVDGIPDYSGSPYVALNGNQPTFTKSEIKTVSYEYYSPLDSLGRCGVTHACVGRDIMPTEDRESISSVKPTGWVNNAYDADLVDGRYIYNRCHLIGFQLTGENANKQNLITGTRYMNVEGMLPFENLVADYVKETGNHVMYRVTPIFVGNNLVASGCQLEAWSVEDEGAGVCFNVFVYNVQPGISIDYATGNNQLGSTPPAQTQPQNPDSQTGETNDYVLNTSTKRVHRPTCSSAKDMKESNKQTYTGKLAELIAQGYSACGTCDPT